MASDDQALDKSPELFLADTLVDLVRQSNEETSKGNHDLAELLQHRARFIASQIDYNRFVRKEHHGIG